VPTTISPPQLIPQIRLLLEERLKLVDAVAGIDQTLASIGSVLGGAASPPSAALPAPATVKTTAKGKRRGRQTKFALSAEDSILAFVRQSKNPTTKDVKAHWIGEGRGGGADNTLSLMVKKAKLKRTPLGKGIMGSRYTVA
jgi:hypothetical protein